MTAIVCVAGATGTGKTKLGVELAKQFNGEVISADSMQIYKGLDIITNKVTDVEADGVVHHCISYVDPFVQYTVKEYVEHTIPIIRDILHRGKLPIIVGGTSYYIEALIFDFTITDEVLHLKTDLDEEQGSVISNDNLSSYEKLQILDPETAEKIHPNNKRKINRSLEVFTQHGVKQSDILGKQHNGNEDSKRGDLRWDRVLLFSLEAQMSTLGKRLDERVDTMVEMGLLDELDEFSKCDAAKSGLFSQVIGYKEFKVYIDLKNSGCTDESQLENTLYDGLDRMKVLTKRYARKQYRWMRNRLKSCDFQNFFVHPLDTGDKSKWEDAVSQPAVDLTTSFLAGTLTQPELPLRTLPGIKRKLLTCNKCRVTCDCDLSYKAHMSSKRHKKRVASLRKGNRCGGR